MKVTPRRVLAVLGMVVAATAASTGTAAAGGTHVKEYSLKSEFAVPADIAAGPDGALYLPDGSLDRVWRVTTGGRVSHIDVNGGPAGVAAGPDGALWVTARTTGQVHRVTTGGDITTYQLPDPRSFPTDIIAGPDGALWFLETRADKVGRITTDGQVTEYPLATKDAFLADIAIGPDGAIWFAESSGDKVGRVTMAGELTEYAMPAESMPGSIAAGPDGALYVGEQNGNAIARITTDGVVSARYELPVENSNPLGLAFAGGELWISQHSIDRLDRMSLDGTFGRALRTKSDPDGVTIGPDGNLWYFSGNQGKVGRVDL
jgi:virginiamycin B lyase